MQQSYQESSFGRSSIDIPYGPISSTLSIEDPNTRDIGSSGPRIVFPESVEFNQSPRNKVGGISLLASNNAGNQSIKVEPSLTPPAPTPTNVIPNASPQMTGPTNISTSKVSAGYNRTSGNTAPLPSPTNTQFVHTEYHRYSSDDSYSPNPRGSNAQHQIIAFGSPRQSVSAGLVGKF